MLKANKSVKKVILSSNMIDDDGIRAVADGLAVNAVVSTLLVAGNPFGDIGAQYLLDKITTNCAPWLRSSATTASWCCSAQCLAAGTTGSSGATQTMMPMTSVTSTGSTHRLP